MEKINTKLELNNIPKLVGTESINMFKDCYRVITKTKWPIYITGPSGSGKSIIAYNIAKKYSKRYNVPAYYVQLSPEQSKTSLILGLRLKDGSLIPVNGVVADCMEQGGIIIIDEATHCTQELLLMFNSILDRTSVTSIGDKIISSKDTFRIIFCANDSTYSGNIKLPQSFAQRLVGFKFDYPAFEDEVEIVKQIAEDEYDGELNVPDEVIKYIVSLMRETRTDKFPLSVRNGAITSVMLEMSKKTLLDKKENAYFTTGPNVESIRRKIANRIFNRQVTSVNELNGKEMNVFTEYITSVGIDNFKEIIKKSFMFYLDIDIGFYDVNETKNTFVQKII